MSNRKQWLTRNQVSAIIGFAPKTLANWASLNEGPPYIKVGSRCLYDADALARWQDALSKVA